MCVVCVGGGGGWGGGVGWFGGRGFDMEPLHVNMLVGSLHCIDTSPKL